MKKAFGITVNVMPVKRIDRFEYALRPGAVIVELSVVLRCGTQQLGRAESSFEIGIVIAGVFQQGEL